jgi:formiminotetrahydrofolate cyclodeaminase
VDGAEYAAEAFGERTLAGFGDLLRSPDSHSGGAAAAAAAASLAAATAALVTSLSGRRRRNAEHWQAIQNDARRLQTLQHQLLDAGGEDERALAQLMKLYSARSVGDRAELQAALQAAAESSIEIARLAGEVCSIADGQIPHASRFTVSDLGASAALARGAVTAALLTAEVNVALLRDLAVEDHAITEQLSKSIADIDATAAPATRRAITGARQRIESPS